MGDALDPAKEVTQAQSGGEQLPAVSEVYRLAQSQDGFLEVIKKRNILLEKALPLAIAVTRGGDWVKMGEYMWPMAAGCEKIMRRFAIRMHSTRFEKTVSEDEKGAFYIYTCFATFELPGGLDSMEAVGTSSSRKPFFGRRVEWVKPKGGGKDKKITHFRPFFEIDEDSIIKASRSNCIANGIQDILGIRHLTQKDLENLGVQGDIATVDFGDTTKGKKTSTKKTKLKENPDATMDDATRKKIVADFTLILDYLISKGQSEEQVFKKYLAFRGGEGCTREKLGYFRKNKALRWVEQAAQEMMGTLDDLKVLEDFKANLNPDHPDDAIPI